MWTFTIHPGQAFSDGEPILPSTFQRSWERASDPDFAGDYTYLFNFIQGGAEKLAGDADTLSGVVADDDAMTLTVTLSAPYANFPRVAGFQMFMPDARGRGRRRPRLGEPADDRQRPVHDGVAAHRPGDRARQERQWDGDFSGNTWDQRPDRIAFQVSADADTSYNAFEAGEGDTAHIPSGRTAEAVANWGTTTDTPILGSYYFQFNDRRPAGRWPGEPEAAPGDLAGDRPRGDQRRRLRRRPRRWPTGIAPQGIPGFKPDLCEYCTYDPDAAQAAFDEWTAAGNVLSEPLPIQFNAGGGHGDVVQLIIDNLAGHRHPGRPRRARHHHVLLGDGRRRVRVLPLGLDRRLPDVRQLHVRPVRHRPLDGNNYGYSNPEFDDLVAAGQADRRPDGAGRRCSTRPRRSCSTTTSGRPAAVHRGDYAYNADRLQNFHQTPLSSSRGSRSPSLTPDRAVAGWAGRSLRSAQPVGPAIRPHLA